MTETSGHGWPPRHPALLVLATACGLSVSVSATFIATYPVLMKPVGADFGWSRGTLSLGLAVMQCAMVLASPVVEAL